VDDVDTFDRLSRVLTGAQRLARDLVQLHLERLRGDPDAAQKLDALLETFAGRAENPAFNERAFSGRDREASQTATTTT